MLRSQFSFLFTPKSLTQTLFMRLALGVALGIILFGIVAQTTVNDIIDQNFDQQLELGAHLLVNLMHDELAEIHEKEKYNKNYPVSNETILNTEGRVAFDHYAKWRLFRTWYRGKLALSSATGPDMSVPETSAYGHFIMIKKDNDQWRAFVLAAPSGNPVVMVGEKMSIRQALVQKMTLELAAPFIGIALILLIAIWMNIRSGLKGLSHFSLFISRLPTRPPFDRLKPLDWPSELRGLVTIINELFARIETSLNHERKFIDMAAHQLRTPLSALSLEAQLCKSLTDSEELNRRLLSLHQSTMRVANLAEQLLNLAQIGAMDSSSFSHMSLKSHLSLLIADLAPLALQRRLEFALEGDDLDLFGSELALSLLLSNLLENAIKYAFEGSEVLIHIHDHGFDIIDFGPGLSDSDKNQAFDHFWQVEQKQAGHIKGSGLGLAIAKEASEALKGRLSLHDRTDGLTGLRVCFVL